MSLENPWAPDLTPYGSVFVRGPLYHEGAGVCLTGCVHCSSCGLGPQSYLTYRYVADRAVDAAGLHRLGSYVSTLSAGDRKSVV